MNKEKLLSLVGDFIWLWGMEFFIETGEGNFVWEDPDYGGNNTIRPYSGSLDDYLKGTAIPYGRDKGKHVIADYCGDKIIFVES